MNARCCGIRRQLATHLAYPLVVAAFAANSPLTSRIRSLLRHSPPTRHSPRVSARCCGIRRQLATHLAYPLVVAAFAANSPLTSRIRSLLRHSPHKKFASRLSSHIQISHLKSMQACLCRSEICMCNSLVISCVAHFCTQKKDFFRHRF